MAKRIVKYPMLMSPALLGKIWAGGRLAQMYGKASPNAAEAPGESWELSCHPDGLSYISNGIYAGLPLAEYIKDDFAGTVGSKADPSFGFPLIVKLIDAGAPLSVQLHPDAEHAAKYGERPKTESWLVLHAEPGSEIICGLSRDVTAEELRGRAEHGQLEEVLNRHKAAVGDVLTIAPGVVHAIGPGIVIAEIQQSSNCTYRLYDYGRLDSSGKPRELHLDKGIEAALLTAYRPPEYRYLPDNGDGWTETQLVRCPYYAFSRLDITERAEVQVGAESLVCLMCVGGSGSVLFEQQTAPMVAGSTVFLPAGLGRCRIEGECSILRISL